MNLKLKVTEKKLFLEKYPDFSEDLKEYDYSKECEYSSGCKQFSRKIREVIRHLNHPQFFSKGTHNVPTGNQTRKIWSFSG